MKRKKKNKISRKTAYPVAAAAGAAAAGAAIAAAPAIAAIAFVSPASSLAAMQIAIAKGAVVGAPKENLIEEKKQ